MKMLVQFDNGTVETLDLQPADSKLPLKFFFKFVNKEGKIAYINPDVIRSMGPVAEES